MKHLISFCLMAVTVGALCSCGSDDKNSIPVETPVDPVPVERITLNKGILLLKSSEAETLTATLTPDEAIATGAVVAWSSDQPSVATVSSDGKVTGVAEGEAVITATSQGKTATCKVSVRDHIFTVSNQEELAPFFGDNTSTNPSKPSTILLTEGFDCQIEDATGKTEYVDLYGGGNKLTSNDFLFYGKSLSLKLNDIQLESRGNYVIKMEGGQAKLTFGNGARLMGTVYMYANSNLTMEEGSSVDCVELFIESTIFGPSNLRGPILQYLGGSLHKIIYKIYQSGRNYNTIVPSPIVLSTKIPESWQLDISLTYSNSTMPDDIILMQGDGDYKVSREDFEKLKGDVYDRIGSIGSNELFKSDLQYDEESQVIKLDLKRFK